jgi:hypothetical protein
MDSPIDHVAIDHGIIDHVIKGQPILQQVESQNKQGRGRRTEAGKSALRNVLDFALAGALALRTVAGSGAIEALASITGAFAYRALAGSAADVALLSMFVHAKRAST